MSKTNALERLVVEDRVTLGLLLPLDNDWARATNGLPALPDLPETTRHLRLADEVGFRAAWVRDVPTFEPLHGDPGQVCDPWTYLGYLAASTRQIVLGTAAIVAPLDHDLHIAKRAASIDQLSNGRLVLGIATGDRPQEYKLFDARYEDRAQRLRLTVERLRGLWSTGDRYLQVTHGFDHSSFELAPKPAQEKLPVIIVGRALQPADWIARHADGWFIYADTPARLKSVAAEWSNATDLCGSAIKPLMLPLRLILSDDSNAPFTPFPLGARTGRGELKRYLDTLRDIGIAHVALNLRLSERPIAAVLEEIGKDTDLTFL